MVSGVATNRVETEYRMPQLAKETMVILQPNRIFLGAIVLIANLASPDKVTHANGDIVGRASVIDGDTV